MPAKKENLARKVVLLPHEMAARIEDFRFGHRIASETEAMRRLLERGLRSVDKEKAASAKGQR